MHSRSRFPHHASLLLVTLLGMVRGASALPDATITPAPKLIPRKHPYEGDPALFGYLYGSDYTFTPSLCGTSGYTLTTIDSQVHCCLGGYSKCWMTTGCSSGTAYATVRPGGSSFFRVCSDSLMPLGGDCQFNLIYGDYESESDSALFTNIRCNYAGYFGVKYSTAYRTIPANAAVNAAGITFDIPALPTQTSARTITSDRYARVSSSHPVSRTEFSDDTVNSMPFSTSASDSSIAPGATSTATGNSISGSKSKLSRSDGIALGVGIGVGLPTIIITTLAWWYPRHRKANEFKSEQVRQPAQVPHYEFEQAGGYGPQVGCPTGAARS